ncbi:unnamed protein product, partial [Brassica oleracea var. botrytis]
KLTEIEVPSSESQSLCPMDTTTSNSIVSPSTTLQLCSIIPENPFAAMELPLPSFLSLKRHCLGNNSAPGEFFLASCPSIVLHLLTTCDFRKCDKDEDEDDDDDWDYLVFFSSTNLKGPESKYCYRGATLFWELVYSE